MCLIARLNYVFPAYVRSAFIKSAKDVQCTLVTVQARPINNVNFFLNQIIKNGYSYLKQIFILHLIRLSVIFQIRRIRYSVINLHLKVL